MVRSEEIRQSYLDFFVSKGHKLLPSASLIPVNDPTLLLIGAGMAPFKPMFTGKEKAVYPRVTTCQKCVRADDIEKVGRTSRHHTFFEMLGNFSFGDYFKKETISWAWEYLVEWMKLPSEKLLISHHPEDDEANRIWREDIGIPPERIFLLEDNFWGPIGKTGPCGPCSEIYLDRGAEFGCNEEGCRPGCDCDRYMEIWNLVFTQYNKEEDGTMSELPAKCIDTGLGFERLLMCQQKVNSPFETDLFLPVTNYLAEKTGKRLTFEQKVIADHSRAITFMIADGITPSNEGRGYVLRRILRRAVRLGLNLELEIPFMSHLSSLFIGIMSPIYPELKDKEEYIKKIIEQEENLFARTLKLGNNLFNDRVKALEYYNQGIADAKEEKLDSAIASFKEAVKYKGDYVKAYYNLGLVCEKKGNIGEAIKSFKEVIKYKPDYAEAYFKLGVLYDEKGNLAEAIKYVQEAVKINPDYAEAHFSLSLGYLMQGKLEEALKSFKDGIAIVLELTDAQFKKEEVIVGQEVFELYDTYGFPLEMTKEMAEEKGFSIDEEGFKKALAQQQERSRKALEKTLTALEDKEGLFAGGVATDFVGYDEFYTEAEILALYKEGKKVDKAVEGEKVSVILETTPFYAESGGQVGDKGLIFADGLEIKVETCEKVGANICLHQGKVVKGEVVPHKVVKAEIDSLTRKETMRHHTATHLMQKALREVVGSHVAQAGSYVGPDRLRFDFSHFQGLTDEEIKQVEDIVNSQVMADTKVNTYKTDLEKAKQQGAIALFGEKYEENVRVVQVGDFSMELCGGTHVKRSGEIGLFKIISESAIGAGLRRIEALCGVSALNYVRLQENVLKSLTSLCKVEFTKLPETLEKQRVSLKELEKELSSYKKENTKTKADELAKNPYTFDSIKVIYAYVGELDRDALRQLLTFCEDRQPSGIIVLGSEYGGKVNLVASVSKDLIKKGLHAGNIIKQVASLVGGSGGGKPDFAQAGGKDPAKLPEAFQWEKLKVILGTFLKKMAEISA